MPVFCGLELCSYVFWPLGWYRHPTKSKLQRGSTLPFYWKCSSTPRLNQANSEEKGSRESKKRAIRHRSPRTSHSVRVCVLHWDLVGDDVRGVQTLLSPSHPICAWLFLRYVYTYTFGRPEEVGDRTQRSSFADSLFSYCTTQNIFFHHLTLVPLRT
jgi:hypothetical protein